MDYLIKNGSKGLPMRLIKEGGFSSVPNRRTDKNSYIDADGKLHRTVLPHLRTTITIDFIPMNATDKTLVQSIFPSRNTVTLTYWNDEDNSYKSGEFYIPDITFAIDRIYNGVAWYSGFSIELIEY